MDIKNIIKQEHLPSSRDDARNRGRMILSSMLAGAAFERNYKLRKQAEDSTNPILPEEPDYTFPDFMIKDLDRHLSAIDLEAEEPNTDTQRFQKYMQTSTGNPEELLECLKLNLNTLKEPSKREEVDVEMAHQTISAYLILSSSEYNSLKK